MDAQEKKELTAAAKKQDNILLKLKLLAKDKDYGTYSMDVKFHNGHITEIKYREFTGVIR